MSGWENVANPAERAVAAMGERPGEATPGYAVELIEFSPNTCRRASPSLPSAFQANPTHPLPI